jgi:hypothetical protein
MGLVLIADRSDNALATEGIDAWNGYQANQYQGYNHVPNIALSVHKSVASHLELMTA